MSTDLERLKCVIQFEPSIGAEEAKGLHVRFAQMEDKVERLCTVVNTYAVRVRRLERKIEDLMERIPKFERTDWYVPKATADWTDGLPTNIVNVMRQNNLHTLADFMRYRARDKKCYYKHTPNLGKKSFELLEKWLAAQDINLE